MDPTLKIHDILRAQDVKRWNIVSTSKQQTLAEHTFNVIAISVAIAKEMGLGAETIAEVAQAAFEHDLDEVVTGDIPTPTKKRMRELGFEPKSLLCYEEKKLNGLVAEIIKIADLIEGTWFIECYGSNRPGRVIAERMEDRLEARYKTIKKWDLRKAVEKILEQIRHGEYRI